MSKPLAEPQDTEVSVFEQPREQLQCELIADGDYKSFDLIKEMVPYGNEYMWHILYLRMNEGLLDDDEIKHHEKMVKRCIEQEKRITQKMRERMSQDTIEDVPRCDIGDDEQSRCSAEEERQQE